MADKNNIHLSFRIDVPADIGYKKRADILLKDAIQSRAGKRDKNYIDDKHLVEIKGIESLIGAGARILRLNNLQVGDRLFMHEVAYEEHIFIAVTEEPYAYVIDGDFRSV